MTRQPHNRTFRTTQRSAPLNVIPSLRTSDPERADGRANFELIEALPSVKAQRIRWQIEFTAEAERWYKGLGPEDTSRVAAAIDHLEQRGPNAGRPVVDSIKRSRHHNMKELRSGPNLRALFAFDSRRRAVVLVGGDKSGNWKGWYNQNIPRADRLLDQHQRNLGKGGTWRRGPTRAGRASEGRSR